MNHHSNWLNIIKKRLGAKCVMYIRENNKYWLKIDDEKFSLNGTPQDVTPQRYKELLDDLYGKI